MVISEKILKGGLTVDGLREQVKDAERVLGRKVTAIVGTQEGVSDVVLHELLPIVEKAMNEHKMKFAAGSFVNPQNGSMITLNVLLAENLDDDNACENFLVKQVKYKCTKVNLVD